VSAEVRPFRFDSFESQAHAIVEAARAEAGKIVQSAQAEQGRVHEEARRQGFEQGRAEGREAGSRAERERVAAEVAQLQDLLRNVARSVEDKRGELVAQAEREVVRLAVAIAEKIVKAEVKSGEKVAQANVRRAVELVARRQEIEVLLNPADAGMVETYLPALKKEFADIAAIRVTPNASVAPGGCVVVTKEGTVDADLETQLAEIEKGLLG
jgi:flagellar assembly protein FliH